jgi:hypothetical protein
LMSKEIRSHYNMKIPLNEFWFSYLNFFFLKKIKLYYHLGWDERHFPPKLLN